MARVLHVLMVEALGLHCYVAHLVDSISKYCKVDILGYSRKYVENIPFNSIFPDGLFHDKTRIHPLLLMFVSLFYAPLKLFCLLRQSNYDIVHVQGHVPWLFLLFPYMHKRKAVLIHTVHDPVIRPAHTGIKGTLELFYVRLACLSRLSIRSANFIVVHGKKLCKPLEEWGIESRKMKVLPHGNFYLLRKNRERETGNCSRNYVLFFGKIKPYKGIETIIRAVPMIKKETRDVLVVVAGFGEIDKYLSLINEEDRKNFKFLNYYIADEDIPSLFQNAAVVVLPYTDASQSGVLSLAYTFGKPVIVSSVGSMDEYVDNGITGFVFKPNDYRSLAKFIVEMLRNRELRETMELSCYKKAFSDLSWEKIARDTYEIYESGRSFFE